MASDISPRAEISPKAKIGDNCKIFPFVYIEDDVVIGDALSSTVPPIEAARPSSATRTV